MSDHRDDDPKHGDHDHGDPDHDHDHEHHEHHEHVLDYPDAVEAFRADKDDFFKHAPRSPIPQGERAAFAGLPYYPVQPDLRFDGLQLEPYAGDEPARFQIPTTDGQLRAAERAGTLAFTIDGTTHRLTGYVFEGGDAASIFVPFLDATSGTETYGAGRYMDIEREEDGTYALDFNLAYHPSCVYDPRFSCPLTPAENRLPMRIEAGERLSA